MSFHNPKMPWSELERVLSGRGSGSSGRGDGGSGGSGGGRSRDERHLHVVDPLAVDADGETPRPGAATVSGTSHRS